MSAPAAPSPIQILRYGEISLEGQFLWGSNYTFLTQIQWEGVTLKGVYKPTKGERPLWDFPPATLAHREVAAYLVSKALGWNFVPPTVYRTQAPAGRGSLQLFVDHNPELHYFQFTAQQRAQLGQVALFDLLINNADRKGGHILLGNDGKFWLIDHGVCFHEEDKLRTVVWDFAGQPIAAQDTATLQIFAKKLTAPNSKLVAMLGKHLNPAEIAALQTRAEWLGTLTHYPNPPSNRRAIPFPPV
ncbi:MAG: SCO1664 family protein [Anaerolineales bacterium]